MSIDYAPIRWEGIAAGRQLRVRLAEGGRPTTTRLGGGEIGHYMRRGDDCWQAAVATCLQVPMDDVPDWHLDERLRDGEGADSVMQSAWEQAFDWLAGRGLRMHVHFKLPVRRRRWIGIVPVPGTFASHCLVMDRSEIVFDPLPDVGLVPAFSATNGPRDAARWRPEHARWGCSFVHVPRRKRK